MILEPLSSLGLWTKHFVCPVSICHQFSFRDQSSAQNRDLNFGMIIFFRVPKSFFRYLEYREPTALEQVRQVLAIPFKKTESCLVSHLNPSETEALLDTPDLRSRAGIRDYAMLHLALSAGLRVSEIIGLLIDDVTLQPLPTILIRGKGRRERALPLWKTTAIALRKWLAVRGCVQVPELFVNAKGGGLSRWGVAKILKKHI